MTAAYKQRNETDILRAQYFCLDPKWENYRDIMANNKLRMDYGDFLSTWENAVITTYGVAWNNSLPDGENTTGLTPVHMDQYREKYHNDIRSISAKLLVRPTRNLLDKGWYLFFATGNVLFLKMAFEVAGNPRGKRDLQDVALQMYQTFREAYKKKIGEMMEKNPNFFKNIEEELGMKLDGLTAFDRFQEQLDTATKELEKRQQDEDAGINTILKDVMGSDGRKAARKMVENTDDGIDDPENALDDKKVEEPEPSTEDPEDPEDPKVAAKKREKEKIREASKLFDIIAKDVFFKVK